MPVLMPAFSSPTRRPQISITSAISSEATSSMFRMQGFGASSRGFDAWELLALSGLARLRRLALDCSAKGCWDLDLLLQCLAQSLVQVPQLRRLELALQVGWPPGLVQYCAPAAALLVQDCQACACLRVACGLVQLPGDHACAWGRFRR
jgi:hypothetical protein